MAGQTSVEPSDDLPCQFMNGYTLIITTIVFFFNVLLEVLR
jgi:hypothetical protein